MPRFFEDGILNQDAYDKAEVKVLLVLKEVNDKVDKDDERGDWSFMEHLERGPAGMWLAAARWCMAILEGARAGTMPDFDQSTGQDGTGPSIKSAGRDELHRALQQVAVLNLNKLGGGRSTDATKLALRAKQDADLLRRQIDLIAPDIIVACGTFAPLMWIVDFDFPNTESTRRIALKSGSWLISMRHPAMSGKQKTHEKLVKRLPPEVLHRLERQARQS
jgi:hypothetical protein